MVEQDDPKIRCALMKGHDGACEPASPPPTIEIHPAYVEEKIRVPAPDYRMLVRGGVAYMVPLWLAEIVQAHMECKP